MIETVTNAIGYAVIALFALVLLPFVWPAVIAFSVLYWVEGNHSIDETAMAGLIVLIIGIEIWYFFILMGFLNSIGG